MVTPNSNWQDHGIAHMTHPPIIHIESHFSPKIILIRYQGSFDPHLLKEKWIQTIRRWHTPYRVLIIKETPWTLPELEELSKIQKFFKGFFLKECFILPHTFHDDFGSFQSEEEAFSKLRLQGGPTKEGWSLKSEFEGGFIEIDFNQTSPSPEQLPEIERKIMSELIRWHSPFCILLNIETIEWTEDLQNWLHALQRKLRMFHCIQIILFRVTANPSTSPSPQEGILYGRHAALNQAQKLLKDYSHQLGIQPFRTGCSSDDA